MILATLLLASAALQGGSLPVQRTTSETTAEGVEVLRLILAESLDKAFRDEREGTTQVHEYRRMEGLVTTLWAGDQTVQHSRAFHLPDVGIFFSLDAALPVVEKKEVKEEPAPVEKPKDDEWEEMRRKVRGDTRDFPGSVARQRSLRVKQSEIDPRAIEQVTDLVLKTVARHATRVEGLAPQETITVALRLSGRGHGFWATSLPDGTTDGEDPAVAWADEEAKGEFPGLFAFTLAGGASAREQNLVIRVALSDLAGYADGGLERLRQRALINRY
jgi:hypothetical protein